MKGQEATEERLAAMEAQLNRIETKIDRMWQAVRPAMDKVLNL